MNLAEFMARSPEEMESIKRDIYPKFETCLKDSVKEFPREYFLLPVYYFGAVAEVSRERVYAYELYHQLRNRLGNDFTPFILSGEVDKRMHILFRNHAHLNLSKPTYG
jgi:hypothetical protein